MVSGRTSFFVEPARLAWFAFLVGVAAAVSSERMFWYWASEPSGMIEVGAFYGLLLAGSLWLIDRFRVHELVGLALVLPTAGYLVEGILTPILYTGGPMVPFFPLWFAAWHGVLSLGLLVFWFRSKLLADDRRALLLASLAFGLFWGVWSITLTLPENVNDEELIEIEGGPLQLLDPTEFTWYALWVTAALAIAHYLLGRGGWRSSFDPVKGLRWLWWLFAGAMLITWTISIPWAAPMFFLYGGLQVWALRRLDQQQPDGHRPSILAQLDGRIRAISLLPLAPMPVVAAVTYWLLWEAELSFDAIRVIMYSIIVLQTLGALVMAVWSLRRAFSRPAVEMAQSTA